MLYLGTKKKGSKSMKESLYHLQILHLQPVLTNPLLDFPDGAFQINVLGFSKT